MLLLDLSFIAPTVLIAMSTVGAMKAKVFENRGLSWKVKMQVYNAMVVPMMTMMMKTFPPFLFHHLQSSLQQYLKS